MTEEDFQSFAQVFRNAGFRVDASCYDQRHFGSWWIDLSGESLPRQRVAWDGKDRWLIVQAFASDGLWTNKWVGRTKAEQSAAIALDQLRQSVETQRGP